MKTASFLFALVLLALLAGCATPFTRTIRIEVEPVDAKLSIMGSGFKSALSVVTTDRLIEFNLIGGDYEVNQGQLLVTAEAPGYQSAYETIYLRAPGPFKITLEKSYVTQVIEKAEKDDAERKEYLKRQDLPASVMAAISKQRLIVGLDGRQAELVLGRLSFVAESDGAGGKVQSYQHNDGVYLTTLYFVNGRLLRWTKVSNF